MTRSLPYRLVLALVAIALVTAVGYFATGWALSDSRFLTIDMGASALAGADAAAAANPFAVDTGSGSDGSAELLAVQMEKARGGMAVWVIVSGVLTFVYAAIWLLIARQAERGVAGPEGQRGQWIMWLVMLVVALGSTGVFGWYQIRQPDLLGKLNTAGLTAAFALVALLTLLGYWLGTALSASRVMRASVPAGHVIGLK